MYAPTLRNIKESHIATAITTDDLDAALAPLQRLAGITEGDVAGVEFSGFDWKAATPSERYWRIRHWLAAEWNMNEPTHD